MTSVSVPAHGTASVNANRTITYTPAANYSGADNFTYTISDGNGGGATATVHVTVTGVNDAPMAGNDAATTAEDTAVTIAVLANDSDLDGDSVWTSGVGTPLHGTATINVDGTITYTPAANYGGPDSFTYTVSDEQDGISTATVAITVTAVDDEPVAANDTATTAEDTAVSIAVLANDTDADGDLLAFVIIGDVAHGAAVVGANGTITYTPAANYNGTDSFTYTLSDGHGGMATAAVSVTVTPVNDGPTAADDAATTAEDTAVTIPVLANDSDPDGDSLSVSAVTAPQHGTVAVNADGTLTYTPAANYSGPDTFSYTVQTGAVALEWDDSSNPAVEGYKIHYGTQPGVYTSVIDVGPYLGGVVHGLVTGQESYFSVGAYVANVEGPLSVEVSYVVVNDPEAGPETSATATVTVMVVTANDGPVAVDDAATTAEDTAVSIAVLANDSDLDGDTLTVSAATAPAHGTRRDQRATGRLPTRRRRTTTARTASATRSATATAATATATVSRDGDADERRPGGGG